MKRIALPLAMIAASIAAGIALAKLPPPSDEAKAKAAEGAAKKAWSDKVAAFQLCKSMDKAAAGYYADAKKAGKQVKPPMSTPSCADPGAYVAAAAGPASKPLEAAGAHSPPQPAATPPSTKTPHAEGKK